MRELSSLLPRLVLLTLVLGSCTAAAKFDHGDCSDNEQCRATFGFGYTCNKQSRCVDRCPRTSPADLLTNRAKYQDSIIIGHMTDGSSFTQNARETIAQRILNEVNFSSDQQFGVIFCTYEVSEALNDEVSEQEITRRLINEQVSVIIGPGSSRVALSALKAARGTEAQQAQAVFVSASATSDSLENLPYFWRTTPADTFQVAALKEYINAKLQNSSIEVLYRDQDNYAESLAFFLTKSLTVRINTRGFSGALRLGNLDSTNAVLLLSPTQSDVIDFLTQAAEKSDGFQVLLTDSAANTAVFNAVRARLNDDARFQKLLGRIRGTRPALGEQPLPFDVSRELRGERYEDVYYAFAFDAAWLAFHTAVKSKGITDRTAAAHSADVALQELTTCDPAQPSVNINAWTTVQTNRSPSQCLLGYTGVLDFTRLPKPAASPTSDIDAEDAGAIDNPSPQDVQGPDAGVRRSPVDRHFEIWCVKMQSGEISIGTACD